MNSLNGRGGLAIGLFALGLGLRCLGLLFKGTHDLDQLVLEWGAGVSQNGIGATPIVIYGLLSYIAHGLAFSLAELNPRFWWAPQKLLEIISEVGIYFALVQILPPNRKRAPLWCYWMNPFFIVSGGWLGFWDGPHTLSSLLAVVIAKRIGDRRIRWFSIGVVLAVGALFKPQGLIYLILPVTFYLTFEFMQQRASEFFLFGVGCLTVFAIASGLVAAQGGDPLAVARSYMIGDIMPNLCNSCVSVWRPVTRIAQQLLGQDGPLYSLHASGPWISVVDRAALVLVLGLIASLAGIISGGRTTSTSKLLFSSTRAISVCGFVIAILPAIGLFHASDPSMHPYLILGRYSPKYFYALVAMAILAIALIIFASPLASFLQRWAASAGLRDRGVNSESASDEQVVLVLMSFGALIVPQLGTRAHISHTYTALVLLIPFIFLSSRLLRAWFVMTAVHTYAYLSTYGIGSATALPTRDISAFPESAHHLLENVNPASYASLLHVQECANQFLHKVLPVEPALTILSVLQFIAVIYALRWIFSLASTSRKVSDISIHRLKDA